ncbi:MAG: amino acid adenylation domain-containing protein, partial [Legionellaceae bacterium]|nr:amino acid adenylation domain-containing protein [Legionellaceae bacterium]
KDIKSANDLNALLSKNVDLNTARTVVSPKTCQIKISDEQYHKLKEVIQEAGVSLHAVVQFAWHKIIHAYTGDIETLVGTTVSGRALPISGIDKSVGLYINTLPLKVSWSDGTVLQQLQAIDAISAEINEHSYVNLASLQRDGQRLFHSLLVFENYPNEAGDAKHQMRASFRKSIEKVDYPIRVRAHVKQNDIKIDLTYDNTILLSERAITILQQLQLIIEQLPSILKQSHTKINLLSQAQYQQVVYDWNSVDKPYHETKTIHHLLEEQVMQTPDAIAIVYEEQQLTYLELNQASNQLAHYLRKHHNSGVMVALCLERSIEMVIAILAVLKSGSAYVPLDPKHPNARLRYQLEDTAANVILTQTNILAKIHTALPSQVKPIKVDSKPYQNEVAHNLKDLAKPNDLAYVIYTSGTTGKPKGVMVEHQAFLFYQQRFIELVNIKQPLITSFTLSYCFDASLPTLFAGLLSGGKVVITQDILETTPESYLALLSHYNVNTIRLTPSLLKVLSSNLASYSEYLTIVLGGETYDISTIRQLLQNKHLRLFNQYGPTECVVGSSVQELSSVVEQQIIGNMYDGKNSYVLDSNLTPLPIGAIGELYIGGAGLARGYLNQPELTEKRFIYNPFTEGKIYKTGDLVRYLHDGSLQYIGRNDFQVKIRGYRIELGEIESVLRAHGDVKEVVVLGGESLAAYIVAGEFQPSIEELNEYLEEYIPRYMIPSAYIFINNLPLTTNGKLDREALPKPNFSDHQTTYVAPLNELELKLCQIWQDLLKLDRVGVEDDFFRLGGHSILAIQASHKMSQLMNCAVGIADLFLHRTIAQLCSQLIAGVKLKSIKKLIVDMSPLSFAQE